MVKLIKMRWNPSFIAFVIVRLFNDMLMYKVAAIAKQITSINVKVIVEMICGLYVELLNTFCWIGGCSCSATEGSLPLLISWIWFLFFIFSWNFEKAILPTYISAKITVTMRNGNAILKCLKWEENWKIGKYFQWFLAIFLKNWAWIIV